MTPMQAPISTLAHGLAAISHSLQKITLEAPAPPRETVLQKAVHMLAGALNITPHTMMAFALDQQLSIQASWGADIMLHSSEDAFKQRPVSSLLLAEEDYQKLILCKDTGHHHICEIPFRTIQGFIVPSLSYICVLNGKEASKEMFLIAINELLFDEENGQALRGHLLHLKALLTEESPQQRPFPYGKQIALAKDYIMEHLHQHITISDLETVGALNKLLLQEGFKRYYGTTVNDFIIRVKLTRACALLKAGQQIKTTATTLGYSPAGLKKMFLKKIGCTPLAYKKAPFRYERIVAMLGMEKLPMVMVM